MKVGWEDATMVDFIDFDLGVWQEGLLRDVFLRADVEVILKIPLSRLWPPDQFVWHYSSSGEFSVQSPNHLIRSSREGSIRGDRHMAAQSKLQAPEPVLRHLWRPPQAGLWKLNFDAGRMGEEGFGHAFIIRDAVGDVVGLGVMQGNHSSDPLVEEVMACLFAMSRAWEIGFGSIIVEGDNLVVVNCPQSGDCPNTYLDILAKEILALSLSFLFVSWSHVRQEGNRVAHFIAHYQPWVWGERLWLDDSPEDIVDLTAIDWCKFTESDEIPPVGIF
ncbi:hypothetical protein Cgig2_004876 [Carnegiea gigantea]|uniref:RNase H type-1 domain-containing protein n=1 Tax=Carnegiea gigantea TaxID=171969 RepID=A0A9Q1Q8R6_9CARY|nr:hypothetical protein Cgig2_004876 [Carnegiea gigantea]